MGKSVRKSGGEWSCGEKAIGGVEEGIQIILSFRTLHFENE